MPGSEGADPLVEIKGLVREPSSELTVWAGLRRASRVVASLQRAPRLLRIA